MIHDINTNSAFELNKKVTSRIPNCNKQRNMMTIAEMNAIYKRKLPAVTLEPLYIVDSPNIGHRGNDAITLRDAMQ